MIIEKILDKFLPKESRSISFAIVAAGAIAATFLFFGFANGSGQLVESKWIKSAGEGLMVPACGSSSYDAPICVGDKAKATINWQDIGNTTDEVCVSTCFLLDGVRIAEGLPCSGGYTLNNLEPDTRYAFAIRYRVTNSGTHWCGDGDDKVEGHLISGGVFYTPAVCAPPEPTFQISPSAVAIAQSTTFQFQAIYDSDGPTGLAAPQTVTGQTNWSTPFEAQPKIFVNNTTQKGVVAGLRITGAIPATLNATYINSSGKGFSAKADVTVTPSPQPDLMVISLQEISAAEGESVTFTGIVRNIGTANASAFQNKFKIDGVQLGSTVLISRLNAQTERAISSSLWTATRGSHSLELCADSGNAITNEALETNNCLVYNFSVKSDPDLIISSDPRVHKVGSGTIFPGGELLEGDSYKFVSIVKNIGTGNTKSAFNNRFTIDLNNNNIVSGDPVLDSPLQLILAGSFKSVISPLWVAKEGRHKVILCADQPNSVIKELNEVNNCSSLTAGIITVLPKPNLVALQPSYSGNLVAGSDITFRGFITNTGGSLAGDTVARFCVDNENCLTTSDGQVGLTHSVSSLDSNQTSPEITSAPWRATPGSHKVYLCADAGNSVRERDESDNCASRTFTVGAAGPLVVSCSVTPTSATLNEQITWKAEASGGAGVYLYEWSGDEGLSGGLANLNKKYISTGVKKGNVKVTSGPENTGVVACSNSVEVFAPSLRIDPIAATISSGSTYQFTAIYKPYGELGPNVDQDVRNVSNWTKDPPFTTVVLLSLVQKGFVTGGSQGSAKINASYTDIFGNILNAQADIIVTPFPQPDLISYDVGLNSGTLFTGNSLTFKGVIRNVGNANAGRFQNIFRIDGSMLGSLNLISGGLAKQTEREISSASWTATYGPHTIELCADQPNDDIQEPDEINNCSSWDFTVTSEDFDYKLEHSGNITVRQGESSGNTIIMELLSGSTQAVTLNVSGLPAGADVQFTNNNCSPDCSAQLIVSVSPTTPIGDYNITVTGSPLGKSTNFILFVRENSGAPGFSILFDKPIHASMVGGGFTNSTKNKIWIIPEGGFTSTVALSLTSNPSLPPNAEAVFSDSRLIDSEYSTGSSFHVRLPYDTPEREYTLTVTGDPVEDNSIPSKSISFNLTVEKRDPSFYEVFAPIYKLWTNKPIINTSYLPALLLPDF